MLSPMFFSISQLRASLEANNSDTPLFSHTRGRWPLLGSSLGRIVTAPATRSSSMAAISPPTTVVSPSNRCSARSGLALYSFSIFWTLGGSLAGVAPGRARQL